MGLPVSGFPNMTAYVTRLYLLHLACYTRLTIQYHTREQARSEIHWSVRFPQKWNSSFPIGAFRHRHRRVCYHEAARVS